MNTIRERVVAAVGEAGAVELLEPLTRAEADRAALIGRLAQRDAGTWLAELLTDLEVDEIARLHPMAALTVIADHEELARKPQTVSTDSGSHP